MLRALVRRTQLVLRVRSLAGVSVPSSSSSTRYYSSSSSSSSPAATSTATATADSDLTPLPLGEYQSRTGDEAVASIKSLLGFVPNLHRIVANHQPLAHGFHRLYLCAPEQLSPTLRSKLHYIGGATLHCAYSQAHAASMAGVLGGSQLVESLGASLELDNASSDALASERAAGRLVRESLRAPPATTPRQFAALCDMMENTGALEVSHLTGLCGMVAAWAAILQPELEHEAWAWASSLPTKQWTPRQHWTPPPSSPSSPSASPPPPPKPASDTKSFFVEPHTTVSTTDAVSSAGESLASSAKATAAATQNAMEMLQSIRARFGYAPGYMQRMLRIPTLLNANIAMHDALFLRSHTLPLPLKLMVSVATARALKSRYLDLMFCKIASDYGIPVMTLLHNQPASAATATATTATAASGTPSVGDQVRAALAMSRVISTSPKSFTPAQLHNLRQLFSAPQTLELSGVVAYVHYLYRLTESLRELPEPILINFENSVQWIQNNK